MKKEGGARSPHTGKTGPSRLIRLLAAAVLCAALCAAFWLFWGRGSGTNTWGEETPYPYTWHTKRGGPTQLSLKNDPESGCEWKVDDHSEEILTIEALGEPGGRSATFLLTPRAQGLTMVTFVCQSVEDENDQRFLWEIPARVNDAGELTLEPGTPQELGVHEGTQAGNCRMTWTQERDGSLSFLLADENDAHYSWSVEYDTALLKASAPIRGPEGCTVTIQSSGAGGAATVVLTGTPAAEGEPEVRYTISLQAAGQALLLIEYTGEEIS